MTSVAEKQVPVQIMSELRAILSQPYLEVCNVCHGVGKVSPRCICPKCQGTGERRLKLL